jgi:hypothetical protein
VDLSPWASRARYFGTAAAHINNNTFGTTWGGYTRPAGSHSHHTEPLIYNARAAKEFLLGEKNAGRGHVCLEFFLRLCARDKTFSTTYKTKCSHCYAVSLLVLFFKRVSALLAEVSKNLYLCSKYIGKEKYRNFQDWSLIQYAKFERLVQLIFLKLFQPSSIIVHLVGLCFRNNYELHKLFSNAFEIDFSQEFVLIN